MKQKISSVLKEVLEESKPEKEVLEEINKELGNFLKKIRENISKLKIRAEVFVGGSFAKNTVMKGSDYDVDIFVRFDKSYEEKEISVLLAKVLKNWESEVVHGSRDYFRVYKKSFAFEVIPVMKVQNPRESNNITDLSYFHVKYINKKVKSQKILDDIILAKRFCYANKCYGAESYIKGFSGYSLELLVYAYKGFEKFLKSVANSDGKIIIDVEKLHKNKQAILMDLNGSKLKSPIILIDPTYKQRNALATLSDETFEKFRKACKKFLQSPSKSTFELKKIDFGKEEADAKKKKLEFVLVEAETNKEKGDVAGSKLLKFYEHLNFEIVKYFDVNKKGFEYQNNKTAKYFFAAKAKKEILISGPSLREEMHVAKFKKKHKKTFVKKGRIYSKEKINFSLKEFLKKWKEKNGKQIKEMYIIEVEIN